MPTQKRKDYLRNYQREWNHKRRQEFFAGKSCVQCGGCERLELDHIEPKLKTEHKIWTWSKIRRDAELLKCQVLCRACHKKKTFKENNYPEHGISRYQRGDCRCEICRHAKMLNQRLYRANKKAKTT